MRLSRLSQNPFKTHPIVGIAAPYRVPDAGQPVGHQHVEAEQEYQHGRPVLQVAVQLADHSPQPEQADHLEGAEQGPNAVLVPVERVEHVVWEAAEQVDDEPGLQVVHADHLGVADHLAARTHERCVEV